MQLTHNFTVPADIDRAWEVLLDIERIAPCMPGAALETVEGDEFTGSVKVRLGPIGLTYRGKARWMSKDAGSHRAVIDAQGKDARGNGTAKATITATLASRGGDTEVNVVTDLTITGKPAQFGRGVMADVGNKLIGQFAECLAGKLAEPPAGSGGAGDAASDSAERDAAPGGTAQEVAATLQVVESASAEQLGIADQDTADRPEGEAAGAAGPGSAGAGASEPSSGTAAGAGASEPSSGTAAGAGASEPSGRAAAGAGGAEPGGGETEQALADLGENGPSLAEPRLADPEVVEAGQAGLRESTAAADAATAGSGLAQSDGAEAAVPVEPAAAAEAAPPAQWIEAAPPVQQVDPAGEASPVGSPAQPSGEPVAHRPSPVRPVSEVEPIDLLSSAGPAVAKRLAPVAAGVLLLVWLLLRRRRS